MSGLFDHCDHCQGGEERWRTLYLVAGMCDTGDQLAAACAEARRAFPDWPAAWTPRDPSVYDIFTHITHINPAHPSQPLQQLHIGCQVAGYEPWDAWGAHPRGLVDWGSVELVARARSLAGEDQAGIQGSGQGSDARAHSPPSRVGGVSSSSAS